MLDLRPFGLNWQLDPANKDSIVPSDYLRRISIFDNWRVTKPNGDLTVYHKGKFLGEGTFGAVSECTRTTSDGRTSECVVKSIKDAGAIKQAILETIIQIVIVEETKGVALADIVGPFAPMVFDIAYEPHTNKCYIFSERMRKTIRDLVDGWKGGVPDVNRVGIPIVLRNIATVLSELYKKLKFNHRDFKSDNCMYIRDAKGTILPRVIDFGFSCIEYKGLKINAKPSFRHCSVGGRDMSQFIYEVVHYNPWVHPDIKDIAAALLTQRYAGKVCKPLKGNCDIKSWRNTYDFYNTLAGDNPNGHPLIVRKVFDAYIQGRAPQPGFKYGWQSELAYPKRKAAEPKVEPCKMCGVKDKAKDCVCAEDGIWENPPGIPCPAVKPDFNPKTKRCVKKCPDGKYRNKGFKCVSTKKVVAKNSKKAAPVILANAECPAGKERNPKTKRCVKVCAKGYKRDANFKCTYSASAHGAMAPRLSAHPEAKKVCEAGKEYNPATKRCVKVCPNGTMRNTRFKCVKITQERQVMAAAANVVGKRCPDEKPDFNPKTKRCVKKCPTGKKRDLTTFACVSDKKEKMAGGWNF
jgi:hypothetical protein